MVVFGQSGCIRANVVVFGKVVVFCKSDVLGQKLLYSGKIGFFR